LSGDLQEKVKHQIASGISIDKANTKRMQMDAYERAAAAFASGGHKLSAISSVDRHLLPADKLIRFEQLELSYNRAKAAGTDVDDSEQDYLELMQMMTSEDSEQNAQFFREMNTLFSGRQLSEKTKRKFIDSIKGDKDIGNTKVVMDMAKRTMANMGYNLKDLNSKGYKGEEMREIIKTANTWAQEQKSINGIWPNKSDYDKYFANLEHDKIKGVGMFGGDDYSFKVVKRLSEDSGVPESMVRNIMNILKSKNKDMKLSDLEKAVDMYKQRHGIK
jgi:hypothetical protein